MTESSDARRAKRNGQRMGAASEFDVDRNVHYYRTGHLTVGRHGVAVETAAADTFSAGDDIVRDDGVGAGASPSVDFVRSDNNG